MNSRSPRQHRAFSLVEILVALGIIAVLAALTLPAIRKSQASSRQAACASNLRQIGQACLAYAAENDGALPPAKPARTDPNASWLNSTCMYLLNPYLAAISTPAIFAVEQRIAFDGVFRCPAKADWNLNASTDTQKVSYAMNTFDPTSNLGRNSQKLVAIAAPTRTALFADVNNGNWAVANTDALYGSRADLRHNQRDNILFCDGHVEALPKNAFNWTLVLPNQGQGNGS